MAFHNIFSNKKEEEEKIKIIVDSREKNSLVASELMKLGFMVEFEQLEVGDYIVGGTVIERKTISDLKGSIVNRRIVDQLIGMKQYENKLLMVEGFNRGMYEGGIHENALRGFLLSVGIDYNVPMVFTIDEEDSAKYISVLARRKERGEIAIRASRIMMNDGEQVQFILEGFPNVGPTKAKKLIEKFGSLKEIFNASEEELKDILGVRAEEFRRLLGVK